MVPQRARSSLAPVPDGSRRPAPPRGYRRQRVNDQYVMASIATGLIGSVVIANR